MVRTGKRELRRVYLQSSIWVRKNTYFRKLIRKFQFNAEIILDWISARIFTIGESMDSNTDSPDENDKAKGQKSSMAEKRMVMREPSNPMSVQSSEGSKAEGIRSSGQVRTIYFLLQ